MIIFLYIIIKTYITICVDIICCCKLDLLSLNSLSWLLLHNRLATIYVLLCGKGIIYSLGRWLILLDRKVIEVLIAIVALLLVVSKGYRNIFNGATILYIWLELILVVIEGVIKNVAVYCLILIIKVITCSWFSLYLFSFLLGRWFIKGVIVIIKIVILILSSSVCEWRLWRRSSCSLSRS